MSKSPGIQIFVQTPQIGGPTEIVRLPLIINITTLIVQPWSINVPKLCLPKPTVPELSTDSCIWPQSHRLRLSANQSNSIQNWSQLKEANPPKRQQRQRTQTTKQSSPRKKRPIKQRVHQRTLATRPKSRKEASRRKLIQLKSNFQQALLKFRSLTIRSTTFSTTSIKSKLDRLLLKSKQKNSWIVKLKSIANPSPVSISASVS